MMKICVQDLAVFGGAPAFSEKLHVGCPNIGDKKLLMERINDILDRRWLTNDGPYVQRFEYEVAELVGVKHCIAVCNGTMALELAIRAMDLTGEVIIPSFTFIATAHALWWQGIRPVFCDIDPATHNIDPRRIEEKITLHTSAIIGVHVWGRPCDVETLTEIAQEHELRLMFDAAHAFDCSYQDRMIGSFGDAEVFSFHATKFLNTFEGGAVVTNDDDLATRIRLMRNFGFAGEDNVVCVGTNGKMNEVSAVMGLTGLESLEEFIAVNHCNYGLYRHLLEDIPGIQFVAYDEAEQNNYQYIVLEIDDRIIQISRDQLVEILRAENVLARRYFYPGCHRMEPYCSYFTHAELFLPETERLVERVLCLPTGTAVGVEEIREVCQIIRFVVEHGAEIRSRLQV